MAVQVNTGPSIFTVKYLNENQTIGFANIPAAGTGAAKEEFIKQYPTKQIVTIYRKS
jgi:hypothetical protein